VATVLVWVEDNQAARVGGDPRDEEDHEHGEFCPQGPTFASSKRDYGKHDTGDHERAGERHGPRRRVLGEHDGIHVRMRPGVSGRR